MDLRTLRDGLGRRFARARFRRWLGVHFVAAVAWFLLGGLLGVVLVETVPLETLAAVDGGSGSLVPERITVASLAVNNLIALGVTALGLVTVGLASVLVLVFNGLIVGALVAVGVAESSPLLLAALIAPHGVVELPAFFLVAGVSFRVYHRLARYVLGLDEAFLDRQELFEAGVLLAAAVAMILVAAVLEVHVTPAVAEGLTGREVALVV